MSARIPAFLVILTALAACATLMPQPLRIDGTTPAAFQASWTKLVSTLTAQEQTQLDTAVLLIGATKHHDSGFAGPSSFGAETLRTDLNGKTFAEIIAAAKATGARVTGVSHHATQTN